MGKSFRIRLSEPVVTKSMLTSLTRAFLREKWVSGKSVEKFEEEFSSYVGTEYAVAVNSGTSALHLSLLAMGIKPGDKVITTPATFIATANSILYLNAKPVFVDISLETYTMEIEKLKMAVRKEKGVKAIIPVHLYGYPCEMEEINEIAEKYGLRVLEDACQAHGSVYKGRKVGSLGTAAAFSFYPSKNMTVAGDGGMVTTNDEKIAETVRCLRDVGRDKERRWLHILVGYTARLNTLNAAVGRIQLKFLDKWVRKRVKVANWYYKYLEGIGDLILPPRPKKDVLPSYHLYVVRTKYRNELKDYLERKGIECGVHYRLPVHLQPPYKKLGFKKGMFPNAERLSDEALSLPMHPRLSKEDVEYITRQIEEFFRGKSV